MFVAGVASVRNRVAAAAVAVAAKGQVARLRHRHAVRVLHGTGTAQTCAELAEVWSLYR